MNPRKNLLGIFFCLVCGLSCGDVGWPLLNKELSDEDIRKAVDQALQLVDQPTFQGWKSEFLQQAVPRMHIGLVELWLEFRKFQKQQEEMWRKMRRMMTLSAVSCQELKNKVAELSDHVPERMDMMEKNMETIKRRMKSMKDVYEAESASRAHLHTTENQTNSEQSSQRTCNLAPCTHNATRRRKGKVSTSQLAHKVAALTELLNGHNELLVELYERVTALEGIQIRGHASVKPQDGSGDVH